MQLKQIKTKEDARSVFRTDAYNIIKEGVSHHPLSDLGDANDAQIELLIQVYLEHPDPTSRGLFVAMDGNKLIGLLAGVISSSLIGKKQANELMWYVLEPYRKSGVGIELKKMYEDWAREQDVKLVAMSRYENNFAESLDKLLVQDEYKKVEVTYVKELK